MVFGKIQKHQKPSILTRIRGTTAARFSHVPLGYLFLPFPLTRGRARPSRVADATAPATRLSCLRRANGQLRKRGRRLYSLPALFLSYVIRQRLRRPVKPAKLLTFSAFKRLPASTPCSPYLLALHSLNPRHRHLFVLPHAVTRVELLCYNASRLRNTHHEDSNRGHLRPSTGLRQ